MLVDAIARAAGGGRVDSLVASLRPEEPVMCLRPLVVERAARRFRESFPGRVLYAVKCNPEPAVLRAVRAGGVDHFDVASVGEMETVRGLFPAARLSYMHPVKPRAAIRRAYDEFGVREFSLDSASELAKIVAETGGARDLRLFVRLAVPKSAAAYDLSGKFGVAPEDAPALLGAVAEVAESVGICFHVGSQCLDPAAYERAIRLAGAAVAEAGVRLAVLDVGGGFPVSYPDQTPPALGAYMDAIRRGVAAIDLPGACELWAEPGRALVAAGSSLIVRVEHRREAELFVNDGVYGSLSDAGVPGFRFPVRLVRPEGSQAPSAPFAFFGPTCDSADRMAGPFHLPADVAEGDWIEIGQIGAYGSALGTGFNGFARPRLAYVGDAPLLETPGYEAEDESAGIGPLFVFGTLLDAELRATVLGRGDAGLATEPARLLGYRRRRAEDEDFPIVLPQPGGEVDGLVIDGLTRADLARLSFYEAGDYGLRPVEVFVGGERTRALAFLSTGRLADSGEPWELERWAVTAKPRALRLARATMDLFGLVTVAELEAMWPELEAAALSEDAPRAGATR